VKNWESCIFFWGLGFFFFFFFFFLVLFFFLLGCKDVVGG